jgi:cell division protein FtsI/penicillin-binding protein 2
VACAYAAVANGGKCMRPHIVRQVVANDGTVVERMAPEVVCQAMKPATAAALRKMLAMVVDKKGTAAQAKVPGFQPGGKTGTAVRYNPKTRRYERGHYTVSFAGLMPAEDPAFVCVVVIDDPLTEEVTRYGGTIAAPVFAKIAARVARHLNLAPTEPVAEDENGQLAEARKP